MVKFDMEIVFKRLITENASEICFIFENRDLAEEELKKIIKNKQKAKFNELENLLEVVLIDMKTKKETMLTKGKYKKSDFDIFIGKPLNKNVFLISFGIINNDNFLQVYKPIEIYGF